MKIKEQPENRFYVYAYLDPRKPGKYVYGDYSFDYEPFYIGKGSGSRKSVHLWESEENTTNLHKHRVIQKIIEETKAKPIIVMIMSNLTNLRSYELEMDIIKLIGKKSEGGTLTNFLDGGKIIVNNIDKQKTSSIKRLQYDLEGNFIKEWESAKQAERELGINNSLISNACLGKLKTAGGFIWKNKNIDEKFIKNIRPECIQDIKKRFSKPVLQYSFEGILIKEWLSSADIHRETKINNISRAISKKNYVAGGFIWMLKQNNINTNLSEKTLENILSKKHKLILQYSLEGELVKIRTSAQETFLELKVSQTHFYRICHEEKIYKNYIWIFHKGGIIKKNI